MLAAASPLARAIGATRIISLTAAIAHLAAACDIADDRGVAPHCPADETCSELAPHGLVIAGASFADDGPGRAIAPPAPIAVGGTQILRGYLPANGARADAGGVDPVEFQEPFEVTTEPPLAVRDLSPPTVELEAVAAGAAPLRLVDSVDGDLLDRIDVRADPLGRATIVPLEHPREREWALYAGGEADILAVLRAEDGTRLVDERIAPSASDDVVLERKRWDVFTVRRAPEANFDLELETSDGRVTARGARVVTDIDRIEIAAPDFEIAAHVVLRPGEEGVICFVGRTATGAAVAGLDWSFEALGPIDAAPWPHLRRCARVRGLEPGKAGLLATAAGLEFGLGIDVIGGESGATASGDATHPPDSNRAQRVGAILKSPASWGKVPSPSGSSRIAGP